MISVTLASSLAAHLPADGGAARSGGHRTVVLDADTWPDAVAEMRTRFSRLSDYLFDESGGLRSGFLVAVNDENVGNSAGLRNLRSGDKVLLLAQMAGG